jgi:hypothetical protein
MNKRIEELAEQAGAKIHKEQTRSGDWVDFSNYDSFDHEKFAGLLIKHCSEIIKDSPWKLGHGCAASDQALLILEHFGVKE